jgi:hypothetical protein
MSDIFTKKYLTDLIKTAGPHMALVIFFVWQSSIREARQAQKIDELEKYIRTELKAIIERDHKVIGENTIELRK